MFLIHGIIAEAFMDETGLYIDEGQVSPTAKGIKVLADLNKGRMVCVHEEELSDSEAFNIYLSFSNKDTIKVEFERVKRFGFQTYPDSPPEWDEETESEFYTYTREKGELDSFFVARVLDFLDSEFN